MRPYLIRLFLAVGMCDSTTFAQQTDPHANSHELKMSAAERAVWEREEAYWRIIKANDREALVGLRDERFVGWPRVESQPIHKNNSFGALEGRKLLDYKLEPLSVQEYGQGVVITFYRATALSANQDGTDERTIASRITHTWLKKPLGWQIISGMSAEDKPSVLPTAASTQRTTSTPLILEENDGEHRLRRPQGPVGSESVPEFIIKIDKLNGNAEDFYVGYEILKPAGMIPFHKHHNSEEVVILEEGGATVTVGDKRSVTGPHAVVFIPRETWVSVANSGNSPIHLYALFSHQGFEDFLRARSVRPGERLTPLTTEELRRSIEEGHFTPWDTSKGPYPPGVPHP